MERKKLLMGISIIAFSMLLATSLYHNISPYTTVSDLKKSSNVRNVQVVGEIVKGSIVFKDNKTFFKITDGTNELDVIYPQPLNYYEGQIVVVGDFKDGKIYATEILRKCHTEYKIGGG